MEVYKVKTPSRFQFGDPLYYEQLGKERLKELVVDIAPPAAMETRLVLDTCETGCTDPTTMTTLTIYIALGRFLPFYLDGLKFVSQDEINREIGVDSASYRLSVDDRELVFDTNGDGHWGDYTEYRRTRDNRTFVDAMITTILMPPYDSMDTILARLRYLFGDISDIVEVETGVEADWDSFIETEDGKAYLMAREAVDAAFIRVLQDDMSAFPGMITDVIMDDLCEERLAISSIRKRIYTLSDEAIQHAWQSAAHPDPSAEISNEDRASITRTLLQDAALPYIPPLIEQMASWIPKQTAEAYGWTRNDIVQAIADKLENDQFRLYAGGEIPPTDAEARGKATALCDEIAQYCQHSHDGIGDEFKDGAQYIPFVKRGFYFCDQYGFQKMEFDSSLATDLQGLRCLEIQPGKPPFETRIPNELRELQNAVSRLGEPSLIEVTCPFDDAALVMGNEEAKLIGMQGNRRINGAIYAGPIYIIGDNLRGDFCDLTDKQIEHYSQMFATPEDITQEDIDEEMNSFFGFY